MWEECSVSASVIHAVQPQTTRISEQTCDLSESRDVTSVLHSHVLRIRYNTEI
jgi:hypothetical protein